MKSHKTIKFLCTLFSIALLVSAVVLVVSSRSVYSEENSASVVLVHLIFGDERWSPGFNGVRVLPCEAPSKFINGTDSDPLIKVLGPNEEVVYQRNMRNPRVMLIEEPSTEPWLLEKVSFNLRFALMDGMEVLEFWYDPLEQKEPSVTVDLRDAIQKYWDEGGPDQEAPCQQPEYLPDQLQQ